MKKLLLILSVLISVACSGQIHRNPRINQTPEFDLMLQALGSGIIAQTFPIWQMSGTAALGDGQLRISPLIIPTDTTVTSVTFFTRTTGDYTADKYNGIYLFSFASGILTNIDSTVNDGNIWKGTANTYSTVNFTFPVAVKRGVYYLGFLNNSSAQVTAPAILGVSSGSANEATLDLPTGVVLTGTRSGNDYSRSPITMSGNFTTLSTGFWGMLK